LRANSRRSSRTLASATALVVLLAASGAAAFFASPAGAAGNPSLDDMIVTSPIPGWASVSPVESGELAGEIQTEFSSKASNETFAAADEGWQSPLGISHATLVIFILESLGSGAGWKAKSIAENFCDGVTNVTPSIAPPVASYPASSVTQCAGGGQRATVGAATSGNLLVVVASNGSGPVNTSTIGAILVRQLKALPETELSAASSGIAAGTIAGIAGGAVAVVGVCLLVFIRRRHSRSRSTDPSGDDHAIATKEEVESSGSTPAVP
jgi:hypothetical protein